MDIGRAAAFMIESWVLVYPTLAKEFGVGLYALLSIKQVFSGLGRENVEICGNREIASSIRDIQSCGVAPLSRARLMK